MTRSGNGNPISEPALPIPLRPSRTPLGIISVAAVMFVYLLTIAILPRDGFWINDNGCKFIQTRSIVELTGQAYPSGRSQDVPAGPDFSIPWPGRSVDPTYTFNPLPAPFGQVVGGRLYGTFSPVFAWLSSIGFRRLGYSGLYVLPLVGALLTLAGVLSLSGLLPSTRRARRIAQPLAVGLVGLATPIWFYGVTFWEHMSAIACTTWAVWAYLAATRRRALCNLVVAGSLSALAVWFRDDSYLLVLVLPLASVYGGPDRTKRVGEACLQVATFLGAFALVVLPLWLLQWAAVGEPFGFHLRSGSVFEVGMWRHLLDRFDVIALLLFNNHPSAWLSALVSLVPLVLLITYPRLRAGRFRVGAIVLCAVAIADGLIVLGGLVTAQSPIWWLRGANGLFAASPILILGLIRFGRRHPVRGSDQQADMAGSIPDREHEHAPKSVGKPTPPESSQFLLERLVLIYIAAYVLFAPKAHASGIHWGCRYLLPVMPLLGVLAATTIAEWWVRFRPRARTGAALIFSALAVSVVAQLFSLTLLYSRKQYSAALNRLVRNTSEQVILTKDWFVPQALATNFFTKKIFLIHSTSAVETLLRALRERGIDRVLSVSWTPAPAAHDASSLVFDDGWLRFMTIEIKSIGIAEGVNEK